MKQRIASLLVGGYLLLCIFLGGSAQDVWTNLGLQLTGVAMIALAAIGGVRTDDDSSAVLPNILLVCALILLLIQLVPMPVDWWARLPGRSALAQSIAALGYPLRAAPISEAPYTSVLTLFSAVPAIAAFVAVQKLGPTPRAIAIAIVVGMVLAILLGALQVAGGPGSWGYLHKFNSPGAVGFFANGNHMATLLLVGIPISTALIVSAKSERRSSKMGRYGVGGALLILVVIGILLNGSLAATGLAIPVILASASLFPAGLRWRRLVLPVSALALAASVVFVASNPIGTSELGAKASSVTSRQEIWSRTGQAIADSFPAGTGLGTFQQIYHRYEDPDRISVEYVNHAHNDYLELVLELGVAGLLLILLFLGWWAIAVVRIWTSSLSTPFARAATIATAAILAHSVVDFPLRTGAISAIFAACVALMAQHLKAAPAAKRGETRPTRHVKLG